MTLHETATQKPLPHSFVDGLRDKILNKFERHPRFENILWTRRDISFGDPCASDNGVSRARALSIYVRDPRGQHSFMYATGSPFPARLIARGACDYDTLEFSIHTDEEIIRSDSPHSMRYERWVWSISLLVWRYLASR